MVLFLTLICVPSIALVILGGNPSAGTFDAVAWIFAAILHGLNDWGRVNGHPAWILVDLVSGILFLGYAKVGSRTALHLFDGGPQPAERPGPAAAPRPAAPGPVPAGRPGRPWWEH